MKSAPRATYRLQLSGRFDFAAAADVVSYLAQLGISHVYASPFLKAQPGSSHGYDVTDPNAFNPEIGDDAGFNRLIAALRAHSMGMILDFVPSHVAVHSAGNRWWLDVLEWGRASVFAQFFDIDWEATVRGPSGKVLLPVLGDQYGVVLENGELELRFDGMCGTFSVWYYDHCFPVCPLHYPQMLGDFHYELGILSDEFANLSTLDANDARHEAMKLKAELARIVAQQTDVAETLATVLENFNGTPGTPKSFERLDALLEEQHWRLADWRAASDDINYRRAPPFVINELAAIRVERAEVFETTHVLVLRLISEGKLQGLRLDNIDGMYDPAEYCRRLLARISDVLQEQEIEGSAERDPRGTCPFYLLVDKILARHEWLRPELPASGTTGYDFMNKVLGLFIDPNAERPLTTIYERRTNSRENFSSVLLTTKRLILESYLSSELQVLAYEAHRLAQQSRLTRDFTLTGLRRALADIIVRFPVYRTYITQSGATPEDRRDLDWAIGHARKEAGIIDQTVFDYLHAALSTDLAHTRNYERADVVALAMHFQQLTAAVMKTSMEDTAFYRYHRLIALNEVGGSPDHVGTSPAAFHHMMKRQQRSLPLTMLATATHDHKRGEDVRARLAVLSEMSNAWRQHVARWSRLNRFGRDDRDGRLVPSPHDEYVLYQTLIGAWPLDVMTPNDLQGSAFADRVVAYMIKAMREAKLETSWLAPDLEYETGVERFVRRILDPQRGHAFLADLLPFQEIIARTGAVNGLAQTVIKLTAPGVPDTFQGCELWDLSLGEPDNLRPVDFDLRRRLLEMPPAGPGELLSDWRSGRVKQHIVARALNHRRQFPMLYQFGEYEPVATVGLHADRVMAFMRRQNREQCGLVLVVAPRLVQPLLSDGVDRPMPPPDVWRDTGLCLPALGRAGTVALVDVFTGTKRLISAAGGTVQVADALCDLPVALLATTTQCGSS